MLGNVPIVYILLVYDVEFTLWIHLHSTSLLVSLFNSFDVLSRFAFVWRTSEVVKHEDLEDSKVFS